MNSSMTIKATKFDYKIILLKKIGKMSDLKKHSKIICIIDSVL